MLVSVLSLHLLKLPERQLLDCITWILLPHRYKQMFIQEIPSVLTFIFWRGTVEIVQIAHCYLIPDTLEMLGLRTFLREGLQKTKCRPRGIAP